MYTRTGWARVGAETTTDPGHLSGQKIHLQPRITGGVNAAKKRSKVTEILFMSDLYTRHSHDNGLFLVSVNPRGCSGPHWLGTTPSFSIFPSCLRLKICLCEDPKHSFLGPVLKLKP